MDRSKWIKLLVSVAIVAGVSLYIARSIAIPPLPWKWCLYAAFFAAFFQLLFGWLGIRNSKNYGG